MDARTISDALGGKRSGKGYIMPCVAHDDRKPSLSATDGDDGRILVYCHAGCSFEDISEKLKTMGLWPESRLTSTQKKQYARKKSRFQLLDLLDFELIVYMQILNTRLEDYHKARNKNYLEIHPEFKPMPDEPWEREITASKRIRKIMGELYD